MKQVQIQVQVPKAEKVARVAEVEFEPVVREVLSTAARMRVD